MKTRTASYNVGNQAGGIGIHIIWILVSLAIVAAAIFWFLDKGQKNQELFNRKAVEISETGLLMALDRLKDNPSWTTGLPKTEFEGGWYAATIKRQNKNDTTILVLESTGHMGSISRKQICTLRLTINNGDSAWVRQALQ